MWYAKTDCNTVIATGETYAECSDNAFATGIWEANPGTLAPYYITTIPPQGETE